MKDLLILLLCLAVAGCARRDAEGTIVGTLERDRLELTAEANEPIVEILVQEGDKVAVGTPLVRLSATVADARVEQARAAEQRAERRLQELVKGPRAPEIIAARAALDSAVSAQRTAVNEFERVRTLLERRLVSDSALDQASAQRDSAAAAHKQANARLDLLLEGTRREEIEQAEADVRGARAALAEVTTSAGRHTITAPRVGIIEALPFKLGERPPIGAPLVVMLAEGMPYARVYIPEPRRAEFAPGTKVRIRVDGSEREYAGVARFVAAAAQFTPYYALTQDDRSRLAYLAEIDLPEGEASALPSGIPVQVLVAQRVTP